MWDSHLVRHTFPPDLPRPSHVPWRENGYYASEHRPLRPPAVESLLVRKISALVACTATYNTAADAPNVDTSLLYAMCKELQVALRQHEEHVNPYLSNEPHERKLFDAYMHRITTQLRMVVPDFSCCDDVSREICLCTTIYVAELAADVSWMRQQEKGCMLNLQHQFHVNSMMMAKIIRVRRLVSCNLSSISITTQRQVHAMLLVLQIAITEHEKYVNQFLSNSTDETLMYEIRRHYLMHDPVVGIGARGGDNSLTSARRIVNTVEFEAMTALGKHDPYNSILGLSPTPTHNIHYVGAHHHGWRPSSYYTTCDDDNKVQQSNAAAATNKVKTTYATKEVKTKVAKEKVKKDERKRENLDSKRKMDSSYAQERKEDAAKLQGELAPWTQEQQNAYKFLKNIRQKMTEARVSAASELKKKVEELHTTMANVLESGVRAINIESKRSVEYKRREKDILLQTNARTYKKDLANALHAKKTATAMRATAEQEQRERTAAIKVAEQDVSRIERAELQIKTQDKNDMDALLVKIANGDTAYVAEFGPTGTVCTAARAQERKLERASSTKLKELREDLFNAYYDHHKHEQVAIDQFTKNASIQSLLAFYSPT